jgi:hypothetical protein
MESERGWLDPLLSRQQFLKGGSALLGAVAFSRLARFGVAGAQEGGKGEPVPIPGGLDETFTCVPSDPLIHACFPYVGTEISTITNFSGFIGAGETQGTATGSDGSTYTFDTDMRFMKGRYVDAAGRLRDAAFAFV